MVRYSGLVVGGALVIAQAGPCVVVEQSELRWVCVNKTPPALQRGGGLAAIFELTDRRNLGQSRHVWASLRASNTGRGMTSAISATSSAGAGWASCCAVDGASQSDGGGGLGQLRLELAALIRPVTRRSAFDWATGPAAARSSKSSAIAAISASWAFWVPLRSATTRAWRATAFHRRAPGSCADASTSRPASRRHGDYAPRSATRHRGRSALPTSRCGHRRRSADVGR